MQTLPAEPGRRRGLPRRLARPARRARSVGAFPAASRCSGIQRSPVRISFLATKPAPAGPGGQLSGAGAGGTLRAAPQSARVCVLDCSSGYSGGRGRGGGGDASRRAGEAGGGAKWKPGSREPGARAGWRAGGTAGAPRRDEAPRGHPAREWRGQGHAGRGRRLGAGLRPPRLALAASRAASLAAWTSRLRPELPAPPLPPPPPPAARLDRARSSRGTTALPPLNSLRATWPSRSRPRSLSVSLCSSLKWADRRASGGALEN